MTTPYDDLIRQSSTLYGLPYDLLQSQVIHESSGLADAFRYEHAFYEHYIQHNTKALGFKFGPLAACSFGLMQILLETALEIGFDGRPEDLFVPRIGLTWGAKKMKQLWAGQGGTADTYKLALAHYNGSGAQATLYAEAIYQAAGRSA